MSEVDSRLPICISCGLRGRAWPPSWYIPTSKETRGRLEGFWKTIASVFPKSGLKGMRDLRSIFSFRASSRISRTSSGANSARVRQSRPARGEGEVGPSSCSAGITLTPPLLRHGRLGLDRHAERDAHQLVY